MNRPKYIYVCNYISDELVLTYSKNERKRSISIYQNCTARRELKNLPLKLALLAHICSRKNIIYCVHKIAQQ